MFRAHSPASRVPRGSHQRDQEQSFSPVSLPSFGLLPSGLGQGHGPGCSFQSSRLETTSPALSTIVWAANSLKYSHFSLKYLKWILCSALKLDWWRKQQKNSASAMFHWQFYKSVCWASSVSVEHCIAVFKSAVFPSPCRALPYIEIPVTVLENAHQVTTLKLALLSIIFTRRKNGISLFAMLRKSLTHSAKNLIESHLEATWPE